MKMRGGIMKGRKKESPASRRKRIANPSGPTPSENTNEKSDGIYELTSEALFGTSPRESRKVLITGGAGYLGSVLTSKLINLGYRVSVYDRFIYKRDSLEELKGHENLRIYEGDIRDYELLSAVVKGHDVVVNLAAIVGDEACMVDPDSTVDINVNAVRMLARISVHHKVQKLIHASTCSNYGCNGQDILDENAPLNPLSLYARSKVKSEELLMEELEGTETVPFILRFSTLFGFSRRPRFDLVVNTMTAHAWKYGWIKINGGNQWRPLLHVSDASKAIETIISVDAREVANRVFNVGSNKMNYRITELAERIKAIMPAIELKIIPEDEDKRNYRVDFTRIEKGLGFFPDVTLEMGVREIIFSLDSGRYFDPEEVVYSNFKFLSSNPETIKWGVPIVSF